MGLQYEVAVADADESCPEGLKQGDICRELAQRKALKVFSELLSEEEKSNALVIAADTLVFYDGKPLGKPKNEREAFEILTSLSGKKHTVCTGISVISKDLSVSEYETTSVKFRSMVSDEILGYIATGEPMDKAGAYGIQGLGASFVEGIEGDYFNVVGLPICRLSRILRESYGIKLF